MLTESSFDASMPLASVLDAHNVLITPLEGSPLDEMVKASRYGQSHATDQPVADYTVGVHDILYLANQKDDVLNVCRHDAVSDQVIEMVSNAVRNHMTFAKNVVAPAIEHLVNDVTMSLQQYTPSTLLGMEVKTWRAPAPLLNTSFVDAVNKFDELPFDVPKLGMKLAEQSAAEILEIMKSGSGDLDQAITEWVAEKGDSFLIQVWNQFFRQIPYDLKDTQVITFKDLIYSETDGVDKAIAVYLIARKLVDSPLEGTEMNLTAFNSLIVEFRNQAALRLCRAVQQYDSKLKTKQLIISIEDRVTTVNEAIYRDWIEAGGENEVLFGNMLQSKPFVMLEDIAANAVALKEKWVSHAALISVVDRNRTFSRTKELLYKHFREDLYADTTSEDLNSLNKEIVMSKFNDELDRLKEDDISDIWTVCLKLICRSRFYKTEAERILSGIERIKKENPQIDIREAAAVSVIEYTSWWVSTQFTVTVK